MSSNQFSSFESYFARGKSHETLLWITGDHILEMHKFQYMQSIMTSSYERILLLNDFPFDNSSLAFIWRQSLQILCERNNFYLTYLYGFVMSQQFHSFIFSYSKTRNQRSIWKLKENISNWFCGRYENKNSLPVREVSPAFSYWCRSFVNSQPFHHMRSHYLYWCEFDVNTRCLILIWRILSAGILIVGTVSRPQNANYDLSRETILRWNQFQAFFGRSQSIFYLAPG